MKIKIRTQCSLQQTLLNKLKMRVDNLLTYGEQLHDRIISLGGVAWTTITSSSPTCLPNQEYKWSCTFEERLPHLTCVMVVIGMYCFNQFCASDLFTDLLSFSVKFCVKFCFIDLLLFIWNCESVFIHWFLFFTLLFLSS
jgi:hypothetical protein